MRRWLFVTAVWSAFNAQGSGFYFGDNGAKAFAQAGAFTAQADDLTAMQYNPAGLTQLDGLHFLADLNLLHNEVTFLRQDPGFDPAAPSMLTRPTTDTTGGWTNSSFTQRPSYGLPGVFLLPFLGASYGLPVAGHALTISLGVFAPPSQGRNSYAEPNYAKTNGTTFDETPRKFAAQRYALINHDIVIAYPTLSAAFAIHPRIQVGVSAQLVLSRFMFRQAMYAGDSLGFNPQRIADEDPDYDAVVSADLPGQLTATGILGVMAQPTDWLSLGVSFRPPIPIKATGALDIKLGALLAQAATIEGNSATLTLTMPAELRVGARATPLKGLGLNLDFVYLGWQSVDALRLTPNDVFMVQGAVKTPVSQFNVQKQWVASYSARLGASYDVVKWVTVHAGFMYETSAVKNEYFTIDFPHPDRVFLTAGVSGHLGPIDVVGGFGYTPTSTVAVQQSEIRRGQTDPTLVPGSVGSGVYTVGGWVATVGVRGHFLGK